MSELENKEIPIPEKKEGSQKDIEAKVETGTIEEARQLFKEAKARLIDVNNWDKIAGVASAVFRLTNEAGEETEGVPRIGYYFKIDVPAPGTETGDGFDWVQIEAIEEDSDERKDSEFIVMRVRPAGNPTNSDKDVAHFFSDKATSNFIVLREQNVVTVAVLGRNEIPNTEESESFLDKIRNALVGTGAVAGFSYAQWKGLVNGVIGKS